MIVVANIISSLNIGGAELMLKRLTDSHRGSSSYRHIVISLTVNGNLGCQFQAAGIQVISLGMRSTLDIPCVLFQLARLFHVGCFDIVQTWMYHADLLGGLAARLAGNRNVIWGIRTTEVTAGGNRTTALVRQICAWLSRSVPHTIVCAAHAARQAHIAIGYDAARMVVVPNGFDLTSLAATAAQRDALRQRCGFGTESLVMGCMGRFNRAKDQENFVRAAGLVAQQHSNVRFLMIGRDLDAANAQLAHWISATGYADRFVLLGERSDVPVCLASMDLFCLSSRTEGFPNVVAEAMAMGLTCVVTDVGDAAMLVADTGVVVPKENSAALAQGMAQLLALPAQERQALGRSARARIEQEFSMERCTQRFEAVYEDVLNNPRGK